MRRVKKNNQNNSMHCYSESFQLLRTKIMLDSPSVKVISVISESDGAGKTEVVSMLAKAFALSGKKVVMIDCDYIKHDLSTRYLEEDENKSLNYGNIEMIESIIKIDESLYIIPSAQKKEDNTNYFESNEFDDMIASCRLYFDIVIIDTISLNCSINGYLVGQKSDGVIFVTVENKSKAKKLKECKISLDKANIKTIGIINRTY